MEATEVPQEQSDQVRRDAPILETPVADSTMSPMALIVTALWAGLVVGFVELGLFVVRVQLTQNGLYRQSPHVLWMIPVANLALFGAAGLLLATLVRPLPKWGGRLSTWLLCILALMTPFLAIPGLRLASSLILAVGLTCWIAPAIRAHPAGFRRLVRRSLPPLGLVLAALVGIAFGRELMATRDGGPVGKAPPGARTSCSS